MNRASDIAEYKAKIRARKDKPGFEHNVAALETALAKVEDKPR